MHQKSSALIFVIAALSAAASSVEGAHEQRDVVLDARAPSWYVYFKV
jgi:hypothetical protein